MSTAEAEDLFAIISDHRLFELTCALVKSGLAFVSEQVKNDTYVGTYSDIPEMGHFDNGMPSFSRMLNGPPDYKTVFRENPFKAVARVLGGKDDEPRFKLKNQPEFNALKKHMHDSPVLWKHLISSFGAQQEKTFLNTEAELFITYQIDRYIHTHGTTDFSPSRFLPVYLPFEAARLRDSLPVNIWIPILFLRCEVPDEVKLDINVSLRKIPDDMQLARAWLTKDGLGSHRFVSGSATHAFMLTNYEIANTRYGEWINTASTPEAYPNDKIDLLFAMLRLVSGADTGYAQVLMEPLGWANHYEASVKPMSGTTVRRYPPVFEDYYWNRHDLPALDSADAEMLGDLFRRVFAIAADHSRNRVLLATRRLNQALLRENEQDAILDATSAMEALLTPGDNAEITHKLATRLAALSKLGTQADSPWTIFKNIKKVYGHRSNVIHGNVSKMAKSNKIQISDTEAVPSVKVATDYLRFALEVLIRNPEYIDPSKIDESLLLDSVGRHSSPAS